MNIAKRIFLFGFVFFILNLTTIVIPSAHAAEGDKAVGNINGTVVQQIGIKNPAESAGVFMHTIGIGISQIF